MVVLWIVVGVALLAVEMHHLAFFALFAAVGAFAAAAVAAFTGDAVLAQAAVRWPPPGSASWACGPTCRAP